MIRVVLETKIKVLKIFVFVSFSYLELKKIFLSKQARRLIIQGALKTLTLNDNPIGYELAQKLEMRLQKRKFKIKRFYFGLS